jgi:acetate kinase
MKILTLNCGSSSAKYMVYNWDEREILCKGIVERVCSENSFCRHEVYGKEREIINHSCPTHEEAVKFILQLITSPEHGVLKNLNEISAVGHRMLHGGEQITQSVIIDEENLKIFKELKDLAPLHNPSNIMGVEAASKLLPDVPHMAVMDTAFHQTMQPTQYMYAVPNEWYEKYQIRRYGFHGTSHLYVSRRAAVFLGKEPSEVNIITLHIGHGVSMSAVKNGVCYDTSMGLTPLEGLIMGTRAGDHDPALALYIMEKEGLSPKEMDNILNKKSGLLGITDKYMDRRDVLRALENGDEKAKLAVDMESYRIKKYIGSYVAALGKVDAIVWTAGVGEMVPLIRGKAMEGLECMGIKYDPHKNELAKSRNAEFDISGHHSKTKIFVVPTDEELVFVEDVVALLEGRYDTYTHFKYSFQNPEYRNKMRDAEFQKELQKSPEMANALIQIPWDYEVKAGAGTI